MKKYILLFALLAGISIIGFVFVIWYAGVAWRDTAVYDIQDESNVIVLTKRNVFGLDCPCLVFQKGTLYHGQDTFEVMKFDINQSDLSWNVISNRLVTLGGGSFNADGDSVTTNYDLSPILRNLADDKEQMIGEFSLDRTSVYVTTNTTSSRWYMYLVGSIVPTEQIYLITR